MTVQTIGQMCVRLVAPRCGPNGATTPADVSGGRNRKFGVMPYIDDRSERMRHKIIRGISRAPTRTLASSQGRG